MAEYLPGREATISPKLKITIVLVYVYMHEVISTNTRVECIATSPRTGNAERMCSFFFPYFFYFLVNRKHQKSLQKILRLLTLRFGERDSEHFQEVITNRTRNLAT